MENQGSEDEGSQTHSEKEKDSRRGINFKCEASNDFCPTRKEVTYLGLLQKLQSAVIPILEGETEMGDSSGRCLILGSVLKFWNIVCKCASVLSNVQILEISLGHFKMVRIITFDLR